MKKTLTGILAVAAIAGTLAASVTNADAQRRRGGWVGPAIVGGIIGSAIIGATVANAYGPRYVVEPGWDPYPAYLVRGPVGCPGGYWARRPLVDRWGNVVGYSRPRFFCPEY